jgi:glycosyltransferase involved in cell wall biosynthesis
MALDLVYFSAIDWEYTVQRPQHLAQGLARHGRVLFVDPLGLRRARPGDLKRLRRRLAHTREPREVSPHLTALPAPLASLPFPEIPWAQKWNAHLLGLGMRSWMRGVETPTVLFGTPSEAAFLAAQVLKPRLMAYDCHDLFPLFHGRGDLIRESERKIAAHSDVVFATSTDLLERMRVLNSRTVLVPNAADYDHFSKVAPAPEALSRLPRPILGYMGEIAEWFDVDAVEAVAAAYPSGSLVLLGPLHTSAARALLARANVHHLGVKTYAELPGYVGQFDVCLLPFRLTLLTAAVNPVKVYEYLSAGKPVVSTPLKEVLPLRGLVTIAETGGFASAVGAALEAAPDPEGRDRRQEFARKNTWDDRVEQIRRLLEGSGESRSPGAAPRPANPRDKPRGYK